MPKDIRPLSLVQPTDEPTSETMRVDQLVELIEHCDQARRIAEAQGETFLSYMLSMTIQAAKQATRPRKTDQPLN